MVLFIGIPLLYIHIEATWGVDVNSVKPITIQPHTLKMIELYEAFIEKNPERKDESLTNHNWVITSVKML